MHVLNETKTKTFLGVIKYQWWPSGLIYGMKALNCYVACIKSQV